MLEIVQNRGTGKAKALIEACANHPNSFIITQDKRALKVKAHAYGYENIEIYDYEDLENDQFPLGRSVYIHNGDKMLEYLLNKYYNLEVLGLTATITPNTQKEQKNERRTSKLSK